MDALYAVVGKAIVWLVIVGGAAAIGLAIIILVVYAFIIVCYGCRLPPPIVRIPPGAPPPPDPRLEDTAKLPAIRPAAQTFADDGTPDEPKPL